MWGRVTGNPFFEHRLPIVSVDTSIATFPKPSPSGVEYFDRGSVDHPIQGRRASDIPNTRTKRILRLNACDLVVVQTVPVQSAVSKDLGSIMISPNSLPCIALEGSDTPGSRSNGGMHCPDLNAQLRMMPPALQEYVRELQIKVQKRKDTSQPEDEDKAIGSEAEASDDNSA